MNRFRAGAVESCLSRPESADVDAQQTWHRGGFPRIRPPPDASPAGFLLAHKVLAAAEPVRIYYSVTSRGNGCAPGRAASEGGSLAERGTNACDPCREGVV